MTACSYIQVVTALLKYLMQQGVGQKVCMCVEGVLGAYSYIIYLTTKVS